MGTPRVSLRRLSSGSPLDATAPTVPARQVSGSLDFVRCGPDLIAKQLKLEVMAKLFDQPRALVLQRYRLVRTLGAGASGTVYEAWDERLERAVALKLVRFAHASELDEARALAKVTHRNVIAVFDAERIDDDVVIVMEFIPGTNLRQWLAKRPPPRLLWRTLAAIGDALVAIHNAGLAHGDIKPENILVDPNNDVHVGDFGLARIASTSVHGGTPGYVSPEKLDGIGAAASDTWAYAVIVLEALGLPLARTLDSTAISAWATQAAHQAQRGNIGQRGLRASGGGGADAGRAAAMDGRTAVGTAAFALPRPAREILAKILTLPPSERPGPQVLAAALRYRSRTATRVLLGAATLATATASYATAVYLQPPPPLTPTQQCLRAYADLLGAPPPPWRAATHLVALDAAAGSLGRATATRLLAANRNFGNALAATTKVVCSQSEALQRETLPCLRLVAKQRDQATASYAALAAEALPSVAQELHSAANLERCTADQRGRQRMPESWFAATWLTAATEILYHAEAAQKHQHYPQALQLAATAEAVAADLQFAPLQARALLRAGYVHFNALDLPAARATAQRAMLAGERGGDAEATVGARVLLANIEVRLGNIAQAREQLALAAATAQRLTHQPAVLQRVQATQAVTACAEGEYEPCLAHMNAAIATGRHSDASWGNTLEMELQRVNILLKLHRSAEAVPLGKQMVAGHVELFGASHPYTLEARGMYANALVDAGDVAMATAEISNVIDASQGQLNVAIRSDAFATRAEIRLSNNDAVGAVQDYQTALQMKRALLRADDSDLLPLLHNLGRATIETNAQSAVTILQEGYELATKLRAPQHPQVQWFLLLQASARARHGDRSALTKYTAPLEALLKTGDAHYALITAAEICAELNERRLALAHYQRAYDRLASDEDAQKDAAGFLFAFAQLLARDQQPARALVMGQKAQAAAASTASAASRQLQLDIARWLETQAKPTAHQPPP